ncbi:SDR family NAD(P)-dependent oxidoreductase [Scytonema sp. NUACC26]|uniref:SDR family NAD(P)-dependent oxidoreductase n=1 Tax=Scytonema sp. NUACC26 TaxID=3140176 RepID=UPI0034DC51E0
MTQNVFETVTLNDAKRAIVNTSSTTSIVGNPMMVTYASTKGAINVFTKSLAESHRRSCSEQSDAG